MTFTNEGTWDDRVIRILAAFALGYGRSRRSGWAQGGTMPTQLRTIGWSTWTLIFVLLILILAMVYLAY